MTARAQDRVLPSASQTIAITVLPSSIVTDSTISNLSLAAKTTLRDTIRINPRMPWYSMPSIPIALIEPDGSVKIGGDCKKEGDRRAVLTRDGPNSVIITIMGC